jgi:hypothetical protein
VYLSGADQIQVVIYLVTIQSEGESGCASRVSAQQPHRHRKLASANWLFSPHRRALLNKFQRQSALNRARIVCGARSVQVKDGRSFHPCE